MKASNKLQLNHETMKAALEYYFEKVVFAPGQAPKVKSVDSPSKGYGQAIFDVEIESPAPTPVEAGKAEA